MRVARWCGLCRDLILSGIDKFLMRSCTVTLFSQTTLSVFSRHPPNYWSKCTKTLIILTCSEASLVGLIKLPGIPTPLLPYAQPFSFCNWRLHFVPTSYSGKVTKGHRPMLNRKFLLIQKLSWGLFFTPSAIRGLTWKARWWASWERSHESRTKMTDEWLKYCGHWYQRLWRGREDRDRNFCKPMALMIQLYA